MKPVALLTLVALAAGTAARAEEPTTPPPAASPPVDLAPAPPAAPASSAAAPPPASTEEKVVARAPIFPLWADKARAAGFELPPAWGMMVNYYYQRSTIEISGLKLGVNGGPLRDFGFIKFGDSVAKAQAVGLRPNLMVLPFLSVYALFNTGSSSTTVNLTDPVAFSTTADSNAQVVALGATFQMGYRGFFGVADFNASVADVDRIADLMGANLLSFRLGYNQKLGPPGRHVAFWAGAAGQVIEVNTRGTVKLADVIPPPSQEQAAAFQQRCDSLSALNPAKGPCNDLAAALTGWANGTPPTTTVSYALDKKPKDVWNMIAGAQFAYDRSWMFRVEAGFLGTRTSLLLATEYRWDGM